MKILVTGGAGFIGSHIVDGLIENGHKVVIIDNLSTGQRKNINPEAAFYLMDIRSSEVKAMFEHEKFDMICHHAAQMDVRRSVHDPAYDADVNIKGSLNLLQNAVTFGLSRFIFASTGGAVYGEQDIFPCDETHPTRPVSPYGISKLAVEKYLYYYSVEYGLKHTILRYANVYGPRQNPHGEAGVVSIFATKLLSGEQAVINGNGKQTRDYVYVKDVVRANLKSLEEKGNDVYNIGTARETDVNELFSKLKHLSGSDSPEKHGPAKAGEQKRSVIAYTKAAAALDWNPEIDLAQGLEETLEYFRSQ